MTLNDFSLIECMTGRDEFTYLLYFIDKNALFAFSLTSKSSHKYVQSLNEPIKTTYSSLVHSTALIKWAVDNGCPSQLCKWCIEAAKCGNIDVLRWIRYTYQCEWDYRTFSAAAMGGHIAVMQYLLMNGCEWSTETCSNAALGGHIEALKWLHANNCPWDIKTCVNASKGGHLDIIKWAIENGANFNNMLCQIEAKKSGHIHILDWIYEKGFNS